MTGYLKKSGKSKTHLATKPKFMSSAIVIKNVLCIQKVRVVQLLSVMTQTKSYKNFFIHL